MENEDIVSIPLVDILSEMLKETVVMSGEDYVIFSNLKKVEKTRIDEANVILAEKTAKHRVAKIKSKAQSLILSKYSLEKQSSAQLGLYGEVYLQEMKDYIANIIRISNEAELNGTKVEDIQWQ